MKFSDIKERYLYYVNFNDVRDFEFKDNHLSVVLKKNMDSRSVIVMPLTTSSRGLGETKILLPTINTLPERLKNSKSYAVYDQIRTVNSSRLQPIFERRENNIIVEVKLDDEVFIDLIHNGIDQLEKDLKLDEKIFLYKNRLNKVSTEKIINLAYKIKKETNSEEIQRIGTQIKGILYNSVEYTLENIDTENGIDKILNNLLNK
jgi:uncharacterized protein YifN (PemK superfamily)